MGPYQCIPVPKYNWCHKHSSHYSELYHGCPITFLNDKLRSETTLSNCHTLFCQLNYITLRMTNGTLARICVKGASPMHSGIAGTHAPLMAQALMDHGLPLLRVVLLSLPQDTLTMLLYLRLVPVTSMPLNGNMDGHFMSESRMYIQLLLR